jgi:NTP pyrophosphatase (non-canonical NTP hydrolase)
MTDFLTHLREVNSARAAAWFTGETTHSFRALFNANEYAGEGGEVCNEVKKLVREAEGWKGSRTTTDKLADEIADAIICLDKIAADYGIDIAQAVVAKFNRTSDANEFPHKLSLAGEPVA